MPNVVIAGSASLQGPIKVWKEKLEAVGHVVIDYPQPIPPDRLTEEYPSVFQNFFSAIERADILFVANEEKRGIPGYIGAETFAEIVYALGRRSVHMQNIAIILAHPPSPQLPCFDELSLWMTLGNISLSSLTDDRPSEIL